MSGRERERLRRGPAPGESPGGDGLEDIVAACPGNAAQVLDRVRAVLGIVVGRDGSIPRSREEWTSVLPRGFVEACAPEVSQEEAERELARRRRLSWKARAELEARARWSLDNWLYWFEPPQRSWEWWDGRVEGADRVRISLVVDGFPFAWGALGWLLRAAGAVSVDSEV